MKSFFTMLFAAFFAVPGTVFAGYTEWTDIAGGQVRIIVAEPIPGGTTVDAALEVKLQPGWKTYWRDPGDAGVPLQIDVSASPNAKLVDVHYPTPKRFDDGTTVWAGYDTPVSFVLNLERPDTAKPLVVKGNAFFGVCEKICVPVQFEFNVEAGDSSEIKMDRALVELAAARLPQKPMDGLRVTGSSVVGDEIAVETEAFDNGVPPELFLAGPSGMQLHAPVLKAAGGGKASFTAGFAFIKDELKGQPAAIHYTLVTGEEAVSGTFEILVP